MRSPIAADAAAAAYLIVLLVGYGLLGWLMAAFQVPWPIWLGTLSVTLHLICSGPAAIVLSEAWVVGVMFVAAASKAWADVWGSHVPDENAQLWAKGLLLIWIGLTGLVFLLAFAGSALDKLGFRRSYRFYSFTSLVWGVMVGGWLYYQLHYQHYQ